MEGEGGDFQHACRRGRVSPLSILCRDLGLHKLLGKRFDKYNLTYMNKDTITEVESVSGSFMFIKRQVIEKIGLFDRGFFMYGEDIDYCLRAREAGFKVIYFPDTTVVHVGAQSSRQRKFKSHRDIHFSNIRLFNKHYGNNILNKALITFMILVRFLITIPIIIFKRN